MRQQGGGAFDMAIVDERAARVVEATFMRFRFLVDYD
jgi:hypothetical protein